MNLHRKKERGLTDLKVMSSNFDLIQQKLCSLSCNINAYSLSFGGFNGIHDGIHVQIALTGGGGANTNSLICHLYMDLDTNKHTQI